VTPDPAPLAAACLSTLAFGAAVVTGKRGLRYRDARAGAAISIPSATAVLVAVAPFALDLSGFVAAALLVFAIVGLFFPATVTLLTFEANDRLGPTITSAVSSSAPLFALVGAALVLGEAVPGNAVLASLGVVAGLLVLSWPRAGEVRMGWALALPVAGAALRGFAQVAAKAGLALWPSPFAAALVGYVVSCGAVASAHRMRSRPPREAPGGRGWFVGTGILNGVAVLLMYWGLARAPVALIAPIVAAYPLVTAALSIALGEESPRPRLIAGSALIVAAIACLVAR
jgi:drug/metabolite transporter (DMT)-like permease